MKKSNVKQPSDPVPAAGITPHVAGLQPQVAPASSPATLATPVATVAATGTPVRVTAAPPQPAIIATVVETKPVTLAVMAGTAARKSARPRKLARRTAAATQPVPGRLTDELLGPLPEHVVITSNFMVAMTNIASARKILPASVPFIRDLQTRQFAGQLVDTVRAFADELQHALDVAATQVDTPAAAANLTTQ